MKNKQEFVIKNWSKFCIYFKVSEETLPNWIDENKISILDQEYLILDPVEVCDDFITFQFKNPNLDILVRYVICI